MRKWKCQMCEYFVPIGVYCNLCDKYHDAECSKCPSNEYVCVHRMNMSVDGCYDFISIGKDSLVYYAFKYLELN